MLARTLVLLLCLGAALASAAVQAAPTLDAVKQRGYLKCGVSQGLPGFSTPDAKGQWTGLDVDFCRAVAAAVLGDAGKVRYTALSSKERFTALQSGEIDLLSRNTTWTLSRDTELGFNFAGVIYYDGQGFMVRKDLGVKSVNELDGATVCSNAGTTTELNVADWFNARGMRYRPVVFEKSDEVVAAYDAGRCDAYTTDRSGLYAQRIKLKEPDAHVILPELISKEPLGPLVRQGDDQWFNIVQWTLFALIAAEELGLTSQNVEQQRKVSKNPEVRRMLSADGNSGQGLGLGPEWALTAIRQVGNYG
ncbi:MAG TPA: amino acid ABC transporter substrate-binding protein, partial [Gammaproteobacteria bacterium]|nr:amino acid ABC transporter substrate-binding protein [Gammaproteobacteria bacterium]